MMPIPELPHEHGLDANEAIQAVLLALKGTQPDHPAHDCDLYLPDSIRGYVQEHRDEFPSPQLDSRATPEREAEAKAALLPRQLAPLFLDAAWHLCRMGILRPGRGSLDDTPTVGTSGYSLTQSGMHVLRNHTVEQIAGVVFGNLPG